MVSDSPVILDSRVLSFEGPVTPSRLGELAIDQGIKNFRPAELQKEALIKIACEEICRVFIALDEKKIIGYVAFHRPHELTRWSRLPFILELGAIEISPSWRHKAVGKRLIQAVVQDGFMENHVITSLEYVWHWDLQGTGLDPWSYQKILTHLFGAAGFQMYRTNDPEILDNPANIFMARIGKNITPEQRDQFFGLLYLEE